MRQGADLENSTQLTSGAIMRCHMPHHVHVDGINGSTGLCQLLTSENAVKSVNGPLLTNTIPSSLQHVSVSLPLSDVVFQCSFSVCSIHRCLCTTTIVCHVQAFVC